MPIEVSRKVVRMENMMSAPVDNEIVILNMPKNNYIGLDEIGLRIWNMLETPRCVSDLCSQLGKEFDAPPDHIEADVLSFLNELNEEGLIRAVD